MNRQKSIPDRKLNNRGFSLIELIVVMAIMVVLAGSLLTISGILNGRQAKQCRDELFSKLDGVRTTTMGKRTATAKVQKKTKGYALVVTTTVDGSPAEDKTYNLASSEVKLYYSVNSDGSDRQEITSDLTIEFDRASGALKALSGGTTYVRHIYAEQNGKVYGIKLYPETGKIQKED
jgi:prepilin-type N-terminal cleavage/methylation domain-containing protein